jgi:23S rRNA (cytidine1920-2'-O)/16S rRNA (cytidine1409-2'-O)-methyltransferase
MGKGKKNQSTKKIRLDVLLKQRNMVQSRERARALILAGKVLVDHVPVDKVGTLVHSDTEIVLRGTDIPFVSRGGLKLQEAFDKTDWSPAGLVCMDVGASTGGFTDCLLQHNACRVYAVDVGYGQLAWKLRQDHRVTVLEKTNIRYLTQEMITEKIDLITIDTSFISLKLVVPACLPFLNDGGRILALIKPQFEVGRQEVGKGGVVRDAKLHQRVIDNLQAFFQNKGFETQFILTSPILGPKGNKEFIAGLVRNDVMKKDFES